MGYITHIVYHDAWLTPQIKKAVVKDELAMWCSFDRCTTFREEFSTIKNPVNEQKSFKVTIYTKGLPKAFISSMEAQFGTYAHIYSFKLPKMAYEGGLAACNVNTKK